MIRHRLFSTVLFIYAILIPITVFGIRFDQLISRACSSDGARLRICSANNRLQRDNLDNLISPSRAIVPVIGNETVNSNSSVTNISASMMIPPHVAIGSIPLTTIEKTTNDVNVNLSTEKVLTTMDKSINATDIDKITKAIEINSFNTSGKINVTSPLDKITELSLKTEDEKEVEEAEESLEEVQEEVLVDEFGNPYDGELVKPNILVIDNKFPRSLNFFCPIRSRIQRERFCYEHIDSYLLACSDRTPPIQLVPFCLAYERVCRTMKFPDDEFCRKELIHYRGYCNRAKRLNCDGEGSSSVDFDDHNRCACEPYELLIRRYDRPTAEYCQRYELYCDYNARKQKSLQLLDLLDGSINVHRECMDLLNIAKTICIPFAYDFDYERCMKFIFDCELITEFESDEDEEEEELVDEENSEEKSKELVNW